MANLKITIEEKLVLDGIDRGASITQTITDINNIDNRVLNIPTGSYTPLFYFSPTSIDAGTFPTGSFKYGRITNKSSAVPIQIRVTADTVPPSTLMNTSFIVAPGNSFFLSTTAVTGSSPGSSVFLFNQYVYYVSAAPSGSAATIEYFIATT